jgi:hypothetical protein
MWACSMHHGRPYLFVLSWPFPVWGCLDSKIRGSPFWGETCSWAIHFNWNSHLEFLWLSSTSHSWKVILLFKDDESNINPESSYALSRRVSGCTSTKFGVRIPLYTQAMPATADTTLDFLTVNFGRMSRQCNHFTLHALVCYWWTSVHHRVLSSTTHWRLPPSCYLPIHPRWCIVHSHPFLTI